MSNPTGDAAADFIARANERNYSPDVIDMAKRCLVDWMGHALDFDDTRGHAPSHLSSPTWSAVLALAEANGADEAAVLGDGGIGNRMQAAGFHPTPVFGRFPLTLPSPRGQGSCRARYLIPSPRGEGRVRGEIFTATRSFVRISKLRRAISR